MPWKETSVMNQRASFVLAVELTRFRGHLRLWEKGVHNGKESTRVST
jgi:hypothetical protein